MQDILGIIFIVLSAPLVVAQIISVANFPLTQKLGLQENPDKADPLMRHLEYNTAIWDLPTLTWLPVAGILMILDHSWWPVFALIGGAVYADAGGREAAKILGLKKAGIATGSPQWFFMTYLIMIPLGMTAIIFALNHMAHIS